MTIAAQTLPTTALPPDLFDADGFLADPLAWSDELALQIAGVDGLPPLTGRHWQVIHHIRERYFRVGGVPVLRLVCRATGLERQEIQSLFGGCLAIWRIAGLPNPGEEAKAYL